MPTKLRLLQEAEAAASVTQQMEAFRRDMAKDGSSQRGEVRRLVQGFTQRAEALIESTLRVSGLRSGHACTATGETKG